MSKFWLESDSKDGGGALIRTRLGKDATTAFHGGVYDHSNAAHNLLAMMRVGVIEGGYEVEHLKKKVGVFREEQQVPICGPKKLGTISDSSPVLQVKPIYT